MATLHLERSHTLGLARSRRVVRRWVEEVEREFDLRCTLHPGPHGDVVEFTRTGVHGRLEASADRFVLHADLGWAFMLMRGRIEREIEAQVDALLAAEAQDMAAARSVRKAPRSTHADKRAPQAAHARSATRGPGAGGGSGSKAGGKKKAPGGR
jgi:putative polyhydroxyalkanoate system protein